MAEDSNSRLFDFKLSSYSTSQFSKVEGGNSAKGTWQEMGQIKLWLYQNGVLDTINPIALSLCGTASIYQGSWENKQRKEKRVRNLERCFQ